MRSHIPFIIILVFTSMFAHSALAEMIELDEGEQSLLEESSRETKLEIQKVRTIGREYCKIKIDSKKAQLITPGSTKNIGNLHVQVLGIQGKTCILSITPVAKGEFGFDLIDMISADEEKTYTVEGRTFSLMARDRGIRNSFVIMEKGHEKESSTLSEGDAYIFSPDFSIFVIDARENGVKFGLKIDKKKEEKVNKQKEIPKKEESKKDEKECGEKECYVNSQLNTCLKSGERILIKDTLSYCDEKGEVYKQKLGGQKADHNYECLSNRVENNLCVPLKQSRLQWIKKVTRSVSGAVGEEK